jgi:hypothetical protein
MILPMTFLATASGLIIDKVRSTAMRSSNWDEKKQVAHCTQL